MPGGALFEIERALAKGSAAKKLNALSCRQIACAVLDGAHGKHWRSNFLDIAFLACGQDQNAMSCCALLAELFVASADAFEHRQATHARGGAGAAVPRGAGASGRRSGGPPPMETNAPCSTGAQAPHNCSAAAASARVGNKRARLATTVVRGAACGGEDCDETGDIGEHAASGDPELLGKLASLVRWRATGTLTADILQLAEQRQHILEVLPTADTSTAKRHRNHGKCPDGHLSVRNAWGAGGKLSAHLQEANITSAIGSQQRDNFRKYMMLEWSHKHIAERFEPLMHAIGFDNPQSPSVFENGVGSETPFRQGLHLDGATSVIIPVQPSGCRLDCLMQPDDESPHYFYRVTITVPFGSCVVFNAFHGGSIGNWETADRRVHAFLGDVPVGGQKQRTLEDVITTNSPADAVFLENIPTRQKLQQQVQGAIELVCKVSRTNGSEFHPFVGHNE